MTEARDFAGKMARGEEERPAVVHLLCHGVAGVSGGPTTKFDLGGKHVKWDEVMELFANRTDVGDEAVADPHTHFFGNSCQSWQLRGSQMAKKSDLAWSSILAWRINVENDDAIFVAEIYYKKLIENGARSNLARLVANDPSVRDRLGAGGVPKLHSWPEGQVRSRV